MKKLLLVCTAFAALVMAGAAGAAELEVLSSNGAKLLLAALVPEFERTTHNKVTVSYGEGGILRTRILDGEAFDLTILAAGWETLQTSGRIAGDPLGIAHTDLGMAVHAGVPMPDTSSVDGLKRTLLTAKSIVYADPRFGAISGTLFEGVINHLGITSEIQKKSKRLTGVLTAQFVVTGEADLAVQLASEILAVPGAQFVPMPPDFRRRVDFSGAIGTKAKEPAAAKALLEFLTAPAVAPVIKAKGYAPG